MILSLLSACVDVTLRPSTVPLPPLEIACEGWFSGIGPLELVSISGATAEYGQDPFAYVVICDRVDITEDRASDCVVWAGLLTDRTMWCWETR